MTMASSRLLGGVRQLGSGRWQVRYRHNGRRYRGHDRNTGESLTFATADEAREWLDRTQLDIQEGRWVDPDELLDRDAYDQLEEVEYSGVRPEPAKPHQKANYDGFPPHGVAVVYVLITDAGMPHYVGSAISLYRRLLGHVRTYNEREFATWRAIAHEDIWEARRWEAKCIALWKPPANKRSEPSGWLPSRVYQQRHERWLRTGSSKANGSPTEKKNNESSSKLLLSIREAAELLDVHPRTMRRWIRRNQVRIHQDYVGSPIQISRRDVDELLLARSPRKLRVPPLLAENDDDRRDDGGGLDG